MTHDVTLFLYGQHRTHVVAEAAARLHGVGARVHVVAMHLPPEGAQVLGADTALGLVDMAESLPPDFWRRLPERLPQEQMWRLVRRHPGVLELAARSSVLVALDSRAVYTVWELARVNLEADARLGLAPALATLDQRLRDGVPPPRRSARALAAAPDGARSSVRARILDVVAAPRSGGRGRVALRRRVLRDSRLSDAVADRLRDALIELDRADARDAASALAAQVVAALPTPRRRADFLGEVVGTALVEGRVPALLREAYAAELELADSWVGRRPQRAIGSLLQAMRLAFHRGVHMDSTRSPLAEDPAGFTAPLRSSELMRQLTAPRGRASSAVSPQAGRPARVVILTHGNTNFVGVVERQLQAAGVEVRVLAPRDLDGPAAAYVGNPFRTLVSELRGDGKARRAAERAFRPHFDWADAVFVDWVTSTAHLVTLCDPGTARVVVRLHSYEAWTMWPHLMDWSRVDAAVFVSDHLRDLTMAEVPALSGPDAPEVTVVPNAMDLARFVRPKEPEARFTIAVIGWKVVAKDVLWAIDVLRGLRRHDPRYRLLLIGTDFEPELTAASRRYGAAVQAALAELEPEGAVVRVGQTTDVVGALTAAGVVISSSLREGSPLAVLEGAASGALPVVRDWPFFAAQEHGPRTLYPHEWVVDTVEEAVLRVLETTREEQTWRKLSQQVSTETVATWHASETEDLYRRLLLG